ncbi:phosphoglycolate phosphatase [soil metagenome]
MNRPLDVVAFDLDGTLVDTMSIAPAAYVETIRSLGGPDVTIEDVTRTWHVGPTPTVLAHFLGRPVTGPELGHFYEIFETKVSNVVPFDGVGEMLDELRISGYGIGVFTSATRRAANHLLGASELSDRVDAVVAGDEVIKPKPAPEGLGLLCRKLGSIPRRGAYVGDAAVDSQCARAAGSLAVWAEWGSPEVAMATAEAIARTPREVIGIIGCTPGSYDRSTTSHDDGDGAPSC